MRSPELLLIWNLPSRCGHVLCWTPACSRDCKKKKKTVSQSNDSAELVAALVTHIYRLYRPVYDLMSGLWHDWPQCCRPVRPPEETGGQRRLKMLPEITQLDIFFFLILKSHNECDRLVQIYEKQQIHVVCVFKWREMLFPLGEVFLVK